MPNLSLGIGYSLRRAGNTNLSLAISDAGQIRHERDLSSSARVTMHA
jgi:hypothetical protein